MPEVTLLATDSGVRVSTCFGMLIRVDIIRVTKCITAIVM